MRTSGSRPTLLLGRLRCLGARPIIASGIFRDGEGQQRPQNDLEHCQRKFPLSDRRRVPPPGKGPLNFQHSLLFPVPRQLYWRLVLDHRTLLPGVVRQTPRSEEHTSELQSRLHLVCRLLLEKKKKQAIKSHLTVSYDE